MHTILATSQQWCRSEGVDWQCTSRSDTEGAKLGLPTFCFAIPGQLNTKNSKSDATEAYKTQLTSKATVRTAHHRVMIVQRYPNNL